MKLTIGKKLVAGFLAISIIVFFVGWVGYSNASQSVEAISRLSKISFQSLQKLEELSACQYRLSAAAETLCQMSLPEEERKACRRNIAEVRQAAEAAISAYESLPHSAEILADWQGIRSGWQETMKAYEAFLAAEQNFSDLKIASPAALLKEIFRFQLDHYDLQRRVWAGIEKGEKISGGDDASACAYGKWLLAFQSENERLREIFQQAVAPHQALHECVRGINEALAKGEKEEALRLYHGPLAETTLESLRYLQEAAAVIDLSLIHI